MNDISFRPERMNNITATDMAVLFSLNPYESPAAVINKKIDPKPIYSPALRRGHLFEPAVLEAFKLDMGIEPVRNVRGTFVMDNYRIAATPDAFIDGENGGIAVVEAKSIGSSKFVRWYVEAPLHYQMQVHTQMMVMDADYGYLGALEAGDPVDCQYRFVAWKLVRSKELEDMMKSEVKRFWECFDTRNDPENTIKYRANSEMKKKAVEILSKTSSLIYPLHPEIYLIDDPSEEAEKIRAIFEERL